jgi:hypothetical protein
LNGEENLAVDGWPLRFAERDEAERTVWGESGDKAKAERNDPNSRRDSVAYGAIIYCGDEESMLSWDLSRTNQRVFYSDLHSTVSYSKDSILRRKCDTEEQDHST